VDGFLDVAAELEAERQKTAFGERSKTTHPRPPRSRRRTMFPPIRPEPIMPSWRIVFFFVDRVVFIVESGS